MKKRMKKVKIPFLFLLCAAVLLCGIFLTPKKNVPVAGAADWMSGIDGALPLSSVNIPGTHNSAAKSCSLRWFTRCQALDVEQQLEAGFRIFDLRLGEEKDKTGAYAFRLMHSFIVCRKGILPWSGAVYFTDVIAVCKAFLHAHPGEAVIFSVKHEHGDMSASEFERELDAIFAEDPALWLLTDQIPTLEEARGKIFLMRRYKDAAGLGVRSGFPINWSDQGDKSGKKDAELNEFTHYSLWVQDRYNYSPKSKWTAFTNGMENGRTGPQDLTVSFLSTTGSSKIPVLNARSLNVRLLDMNGAQIHGWVLVDFGTAQTAAKIYGAD